MNRADRSSLQQERHALILAAGQGKRFKSKQPKILHTLCGKALIAHTLDELPALGLGQTIVVIGHQAETIERALSPYPVRFVKQKVPLGTGHAVMAARSQLTHLSGGLLVLYGDTPLISSQTLARLLETREREDADLVLLTACYPDPTGYGRIIRDSQGKALDIIEEKEATPQQKKIQEVNVGFTCFRISSLLEALSSLTKAQNSGEYYLTDLLRILREAGKKVITLDAENHQETLGINDRVQLATAESHLRLEIARQCMREGVNLLDPSSVYIDATVTIGVDTVIYPGVIIEGHSRIGPGCTILSYSYLKDVLLEENVLIDHCTVVRESKVGKHARVGPFAHLSRECVIESHVRIGNFVEIKKSHLGKGTKAAHLAYLGDAEIGRQVNIGAGTITCNYDGFQKNKTIIEDQVFVGSNSQLVAPVRIHKGAYIAAGSSIIEDVPAYSLGIARKQQVIKKGWARRRKLQKKPKL